MYFIRYAKNAIVSHVLISLYFRDYLMKSLLYSLTIFAFYGWLMLLYIHLSNITDLSFSFGKASYIVFILIISMAGVNGFITWLGHNIMKDDLNEDFENWKFVTFISVIGIFVLVSIIMSFVPKIENTRLNMYSEAYIVEQILISSCIYSMLYYNLIIQMILFTILSLSLFSDRIYHVIIDKLIIGKLNFNDSALDKAKINAVFADIDKPVTIS